jgi:hypothetical protein
VNAFCSTCGATLAPDTKFCGSCGTGATAPPQPVPSTAVPYPTHSGGKCSTALPAPPSLHWGILLALTVVTLGMFAYIWAFVQAIWVKRLTGTLKPLIWFSAALALNALMFTTLGNPDSGPPVKPAISISGLFFMLAVFSLRKYILRHYNLTLGRWQTFFGSIFWL